MTNQLKIFMAAMKALKQECFDLAEKANLFLEVDEAGNIWLGEEKQGECFKVNGWHLTHQKINEIIKEKELSSFGNTK